MAALRSDRLRGGELGAGDRPPQRQHRCFNLLRRNRVQAFQPVRARREQPAGGAGEGRIECDVPRVSGVVRTLITADDDDRAFAGSGGDMNRSRRRTDMQIGACDDRDQIVERGATA